MMEQWPEAHSPLLLAYNMQAAVAAAHATTKQGRCSLFSRMLIR